MATSPSFIANAILASGTAAFGTALDGSTTPTTLISGSASVDTRILEIDVKASATNTASLVNVFVTTNGGATWRLFDSISLTAVTIGTSTSAGNNSKTYSNLVIPAGTANQLGVLSTVNEARNIFALGGAM